MHWHYYINIFNNIYLQSVNEAKCLNATFSFPSFVTVAAAEVPATAIIPFTNIYATLSFHKLSFDIVVLVGDHSFQPSFCNKYGW